MLVGLFSILVGYFFDFVVFWYKFRVIFVSLLNIIDSVWLFHYIVFFAF